MEVRTLLEEETETGTINVPPDQKATAESRRLLPTTKRKINRQYPGIGYMIKKNQNVSVGSDSFLCIKDCFSSGVTIIIPLQG